MHSYRAQACSTMNRPILVQAGVRQHKGFCLNVYGTKRVTVLFQRLAIKQKRHHYCTPKRLSYKLYFNYM